MKTLILAAILGLSQFAAASAYEERCWVESENFTLQIPTEGDVVAVVGNPEEELTFISFPREELLVSNRKVLETLDARTWSDDGISYQSTKTYEQAWLEMKDGSPLPFIEDFDAGLLIAKMTCIGLSSAKEITLPIITPSHKY